MSWISFFKKIAKIFFAFLLVACTPETINKDQLQIRNNLFYKVNSTDVYTGFVTSSYSNNQVKEFIQIKNGVYDGEFATYRSNGSLESKGTFTNGSGKVFFFDHEGKEKKIQYYFNNQQEDYEVLVIDDLKLFELDASQIFKELMLKSISDEEKIYDREALENILLQEILEELGVADVAMDVAFSQYITKLLMENELEDLPFTYGYISEKVNFNNQLPSAVSDYFLSMSYWQEYCQNAKFRCLRLFGIPLNKKVNIDLQNEGVDGYAFTVNDNLIRTEYMTDEAWYIKEYSLTEESVEESRLIISGPNIFNVQEKVDGKYQLQAILNTYGDKVVRYISDSNFEEKTEIIFHEKTQISISPQSASCLIYDGDFFYISDSDFGDLNELKESVNSIEGLMAQLTMQNDESSLCLKLFQYDEVNKRLEKFYLEKKKKQQIEELERKRELERKEYLRTKGVYLDVLKELKSDDGLPTNLISEYKKQEQTQKKLSRTAAVAVTRILRFIDVNDLDSADAYINELPKYGLTQYDLGVLNYYAAYVEFKLEKYNDAVISYNAVVNNSSLSKSLIETARCYLASYYLNEEKKLEYLENLFHCAALAFSRIPELESSEEEFLREKQIALSKLEELTAAYVMLGLNEFPAAAIMEVKKLAEFFNLPMSEYSLKIYRQLVNEDKIDVEITIQEIKNLHFEVKIELDDLFADYTPIYKVQPIYPRRAAERNMEGYVIVSFTITEQGTIEDALVIEGKCRLADNRSGEFIGCTMFNSATLRAAAKLKYKPAIKDGKAVAVKDVTHKFTFELDN